MVYILSDVRFTPTQPVSGAKDWRLEERLGRALSTNLVSMGSWLALS